MPLCRAITKPAPAPPKTSTASSHCNQSGGRRMAAHRPEWPPTWALLGFAEGEGSPDEESSGIELPAPSISVSPEPFHRSGCEARRGRTARRSARTPEAPQAQRVGHDADRGGG